MSQAIQLQVTQVGLEQSINAAMRRASGSAKINLGTNSRQINALSQPLGRITGQADDFSKSMGAANARVLAFGAAAGIIAGVSRAMSGLVSSTIEVEKSLVSINTILGQSSAAIEKFGQEIFNVARNTGKSFAEVAEGALDLARQGLSATETLERLNDALILSRLSGLDAAKSVAGITAAFNAFKSSGISTAEILNKVVAVAQNFAVSEKDIIEGIGRSASVADLAGVSFDELAAIITAVQEKTARGGAVIGNSFKTIFARIQKKAVLTDLQELGITVTDLQGDVLPALRILENLAAKMDSFSQIEQADIATKLGGVFQLDRLLAALNDLSSEASVTQKALSVAANAGTSAYEKNILLNQTLAAMLNKASVNAQELGAKLGEIGVTDSLKNILGFFNNLLEGIRNILGEESGLGTMVRGLVKGLGNLFAGPGLALFGAIILKLSKDLVQFGFLSLKTFFGIGKAAKEVQSVENAISQVLARNVDLQQRLFQLEGNRAGQLKLITGALVEQEALLRRSASISSGLAAPLYGVGVRATDSGLRIKNKAGGYMPAIAKESQAINSGVGGARRGDKPVVIPNFNFGQGKKGTVVAHTGEYVVPNFGGGKGSAIFNRDMVQKMGLPDGAKKITASGGLIPNFKDVEITKKASEFSSLGRLVAAKKVDSIDSFTSSISPIEQTLTSSEYTKKSQKLLKEIVPRFGKNNLQINKTKLDKTLEFFKKAGVDNTSIQTFKSAMQNLDTKRPTSGQFLNIQNRMKGILGEIDASKMSGQKLNQGNSFLDLSDGSEVKTVKSLKASEILKKGINQYLLSSNIYDGKDNKTQLGKIPVYLPKGTPLLNSASGFIPNFAPKFNAETVRRYANDIEKYKSPTKDFYEFPDGTGGYGANVRLVLSRSQSKAVTNRQEKEKKISDKGFYNLDADALGGILLVSPRFGKNKGSLDTSMPIGKIPFFNQEKSPSIDKNKYIKLKGIKTTNTPSGRDLQALQGDISQLFAGGIVDLAYKLYGSTFDPASGGEFANKLKSLDPSKKQQLLPAAAQGDLFEAAGKVALNSFANLESLFGSAEQSRPFDFQNASALQKMFGVNARRGEAKRGGEKNFSSSDQVSGIVKKVFNDPEYSLTALESLRGQGAFNFSKAQKAAQATNAAGGFIPNFAKVNDLVRNFPTTLLPKLNISESSDKRLLGDDSVNLTGNIFQKMFIAKKRDEDNKTYEDRIRKKLGYRNSSSLFGKDNSAIDGFKNSNSFLEVKGGKYDDRDVKLKFLRAPVENYGTGNPLDIWTKNRDNLSVLGLLVHNNEKEKYATGGRTPIKDDFRAVDKLRANKYGRPSRFAAGGFIPNFATKPQQMGSSGGYGSFFDLGRKKIIEEKNGKPRTVGVGVKTFKDFVPNRMIEHEWLAAEYLNRNVNIPSVRGPENLSNLETSLRKKRITKEVVNDSLARLLLGQKISHDFGHSVLRAALNRAGLDIGDLHGSNYTVNQAAADVINKMDKFSSNPSDAMNTLEGIKNSKGRINVLDVGAATFSDATKRNIDIIKKNEEIKSRRARKEGANPKTYGAAGGFLPNFANPLQDAVGREMAAGVPESQIYIDKNQSLKSAANPMGLMVANRRDEPAGGFQGINRARKEGANPKTYGAAGGFVPNYAVGGSGPDLNNFVGLTRGQALTKELELYVDAMRALKAELDKAAIDHKKARGKNKVAIANQITALQENERALEDSSKATRRAIQEQTKGVLGSGRSLTGRRATIASPAPGGNRDMLGTIFAVQAGLSVLTGATEGATSSLAKYTNVVSGSIGTATSTLFAFQGLATAIPKAAGFLGPLGIAASAVTAAYQIGTGILNEHFGINKLVTQSLHDISKAAEEASVNLSKLDPETKAEIEKESKDLLAAGLKTGRFQTITAMGGGLGGGQRMIFEESARFEKDVSGKLAKNAQDSIAQARGAGVASEKINAAIQKYSDDALITLDEARELPKVLANLMREVKELAESGLKEIEESTDPDVVKAREAIAKMALPEIAKQVDPSKMTLAERAIFAGYQPDMSLTDAAAREKKLIEDYRKGEGDIPFKFKNPGDPTTDPFTFLRTKFKETLPEAGPAQNQYLTDFGVKTSQAAKAKGEAEKEAIEQIKTSLAQDKLRNALANTIAKARRFESDELGQSLLKGKELGNLTEKQIQELEDTIALREIERKLQDDTASIIQAQIDKAKGITASAEEALALEKRLKNLNSEDLKDKDRVLEILDQTNVLLSEGKELSDEQEKASKEKLENLLKNYDLDKASLKLEKEKTAEYREQNRQLDLIGQASKRALEAQSFNREIGTTRSINANDLRVRALESSKLGASDSQIRQIDQQIAAINANTVALEQSSAREKIFEDMKKELSENNKITDEATKQQKESQIQEAKTIEELSDLAAQIFMMNTGQSRQLNQSQLLNFLQKFRQNIETQDAASAAAKAKAAADLRDAGRIAPVIDALEMFRRSLLETSQIIDQKIEDIKLQQLTSISGREILAGDYDIETLMQQAGKTTEEAARIARERQNKSVSQLFNEEYGKTAEEQALDLKKTIVDGSVQFKNNMIEAMMGAVEGTSSLKDGLRSAAYEFVKTINQRMMSNLVDKIVGGNVQSGGGGGGGGGLIQGIGSFLSNIGRASGGMVNGGSGSKDDVPAMLMGGEYVVNKKAVSKYGAQFLESINNGTLTGYAKGGAVQRGPQGNFYTPGTFGTGAIEGKRNLLDFATQTGTTGQFDKMINQSGYQAIDLEPESSRLSVSGMRNSPQFEATQAAKEQAFDLYLQQYRAEKEAKKAEKEQKKAFRKQLLMLAVSAIAAPVLGAAGAGFGAAFKGASGQGIMSQLGAGFKGIFTGGNVAGTQVGGLGNLFSSAGKALAGDFTGAGAQFKLSQGIIPKAIPVAGINSKISTGLGGAIPSGAAKYKGASPIGDISPLEFNLPIDESSLSPLAERELQKRQLARLVLINKYKLSPVQAKDIIQSSSGIDLERIIERETGQTPIFGKEGAAKRAIGGMIPSTSGIDTVPAMLSGGEFVMNRSAVQGIGASNLQSMNSGGTSITSEETSKELNEKLLAKLDELINASGSTGDITINVAPSGQTTQETSQDPSAGRQQLARQIKDAVLQVINDEKRIGGALRR